MDEKDIPDWESLVREQGRLAKQHLEGFVNALQNRDRKAAAHHAKEYGIYRQRLGYCQGVIATLRHIYTQGPRPALSNTRRMR